MFDHLFTIISPSNDAIGFLKMCKTLGKCSHGEVGVGGSRTLVRNYLQILRALEDKQCALRIIASYGRE